MSMYDCRKCGRVNVAFDHPCTDTAPPKRSGCIETPLGKSSAGYGQFKVKGIAFLAHRLSYELAYGPIPNNLMVRHKCDNPACVNPLHLELGTTQDNTADRVARRRCARGERNGYAKVLEPQVIEMRELRQSGAKLRELAERYGVTISAVSMICNRKVWKDI